jgi:hypothetical protein
LALKNHDFIRPQILEEIVRKSALKGMAAKRIAAPSPCPFLPTTFHLHPKHQESKFRSAWSGSAAVMEKFKKP